MKRYMSKVGRQSCHGVKGYIDIGMLVELLGELLVGLLVLSVALVSAASAVLPEVTAWISGDSEQEAAIELQMVEIGVAAYHDGHDGNLPTVEGFPRADEMDEYVAGGVAALRGTYTLDGTTGVVTQTSYQGNGSLLTVLEPISNPG